MYRQLKDPIHSSFILSFIDHEGSIINVARYANLGSDDYEFTYGTGNDVVSVPFEVLDATYKWATSPQPAQDVNYWNEPVSDYAQSDNPLFSGETDGVRGIDVSNPLRAEPVFGFEDSAANDGPVDEEAEEVREFVNDVLAPLRALGLDIHVLKVERM